MNTLIALAYLLAAGLFGVHPPFAEVFPSVFSIVIGSISFAGSMVALAKLQELMTGTPITYPGQQIVNGLLAAAIIGFAIAVLAIASIPFSFLSLLVLALILGVAFVLPLGGAGPGVAIGPGYGLALPSAPHAARGLADVLEKRGVDVEYAIHPVAGRMPGHMNVLLAEANVPYEQLKEMDQVNDDFTNADVALIVGA